MADLPSENEIGRAMTVIHLFAAARAEADEAQVAKLKAIPDNARTHDWSIARMAREVRAVMGPGWIPTGEHADAILRLWGIR